MFYIYQLDILIILDERMVAGWIDGRFDGWIDGKS